MIPDYQTLMLPLLKTCKTETMQTKTAMRIVADQFGLTEDERREMLPSDNQGVLSNRVHWAKTYLKQAGLVRYPARAHFQITDEGRRILQSNPQRIDVKFLMQFPAFVEFRERRGTRHGNQPNGEAQQVSVLEAAQTPSEALRIAYADIQHTFAAELLDRVRNATPKFFEDLIVDLLVAMGYGGTAEDAGQALGGSGDGGVDGVIDQDPLGVDQVYVQAKRYQEGSNIGGSAIRDFFGALNLKKAQKGIFFTSSDFTPQARETVEGLGTRIVLINGKRLAKLMMKYNIGCREVEILRLSRIDDEFFDKDDSL